MNNISVALMLVYSVFAVGIDLAVGSVDGICASCILTGLTSSVYVTRNTESYPCWDWFGCVWDQDKLYSCHCH